MLEFVLIILSYVVAGIVCFISIRSNRRDNVKYDERQKINRGISFGKSFFTLMIFNTVYAFLKDCFGLEIFENLSTANTFGLLLSLFVFASTSIKNSSYIAVRQSLKEKVLLMGIAGFVDFIIGLIYIFRGEFLVNGLITGVGLYFFIGIIFIILAFQLMFISLKNKDSIDDEDEEEE